MDVQRNYGSPDRAVSGVSQSFLQLGRDDRSKILQSAAAELGITAQILEKDVWVCWVLGKLFQMPDAKPMAFKGGTSLSKIWDAISRFSEDIDVTIDYRSFGTGFDHRKGELSSNQRKKISEELRAAVKQYTVSTVLPYLAKELSSELPEETSNLAHSENGEQLTINYPSAVSVKNPYILDSVLLEFGGRNTLEPNGVHSVITYIDGAKGIEGVTFPEAHGVVAIDVLKTFWEKVTLIHAACGKDAQTVRAERLSRHWYDLHMLVTGSHVGLGAALQEEALLREVIAIKNVFYYAGSAKYDRCLKGGLVLEPDAGLIERIATDYEEMRGMNLVAGESPTFEAILVTIGKIQSAVNRHFK